MIRSKIFFYGQIRSLLKMLIYSFKIVNCLVFKIVFLHPVEVSMIDTGVFDNLF